VKHGVTTYVAVPCMVLSSDEGSNAFLKLSCHGVNYSGKMNCNIIKYSYSILVIYFCFEFIRKYLVSSNSKNMMPIECTKRSLISHIYINNLFALSFSLVAFLGCYVILDLFFSLSGNFFIPSIIASFVYCILQGYWLLGQDEKLNADEYSKLAKKYNESFESDRAKAAIELVERFHCQWHYFSFEPKLKNNHMKSLIDTALKASHIKYEKKLARLKISEALYLCSRSNAYFIRASLSIFIFCVLFYQEDISESVLKLVFYISVALVAYYLRATLIIRNNLHRF